MQPGVRHLADGVHLIGPHPVPFWPGSFAQLRKRFIQVAEAMEDKASKEWNDAQRLITQISMPRPEFEAQPNEEKTAWLVNMPVIELSPTNAGLLVYSPLPLDDQGTLRAALDQLGPVRVVVAPSAAHTLGLESFRAAYPNALFLCPRGGGFLGMDVVARMGEIGFHRALNDASAFVDDETLSPLLGRDFEVEVTRDNAVHEVMLYHRPSRTVLTSDTVYKTDAVGAGPGPGGPENQYLAPAWFASAYQTLNLDSSPNRTLPDNRVFIAKHPKFDADGLRASLRRVLSWEIDWLLCCHTDPIPGSKAKQVLLNSWGWFLESGT